MDTSDLITAIRSYHRKRCFAIDQRKRNDSKTQSFLRVQLGWKEELPEKDSAAIKETVKALFKCADKVVKDERTLDRLYERRKSTVLKKNAGLAPNKMKPLPVRGSRKKLAMEDTPLWEAWGEFLIMTIHGRAAFDKIEEETTAAMEKLAEQLPVWKTWGEGVRGFGACSLAVIVGEAGDLSGYATHSRLWKRMGLAVMDGIRQGGLKKTASADEWSSHGYNPKRRSQMFVIGENLVRQGELYREIYLARKQFLRDRAVSDGLTVLPSAKIPKGMEAQCMSDGHIHKSAQRYMEKALLRHLHREWRKATSALPEEATETVPSVLEKAA